MRTCFDKIYYNFLSTKLNTSEETKVFGKVLTSREQLKIMDEKSRKKKEVEREKEERRKQREEAKKIQEEKKKIKDEEKRIQDEEKENQVQRKVTEPRKGITHMQLNCCYCVCFFYCSEPTFL